MVQRRGTVRGIPTNKTIKASYFDLGSPKHDTCEMYVIRKIDPNDPNQSFYRNRYSIEMSMGRANRWQMLQQWDDENSGGGDNDDDRHHHTVSKSQVKKERIEQNRNEKKLAHEMSLHLKDKHKRKVLKKEVSQNGNNSKDDEDENNRDENTSGDNSKSTKDKKVLKVKGGKNKKKRQESEEDHDDEEEEETREMVRVMVGGLSDQRSGSGRTITVPGDELRRMARMNEHDHIDSVFITKTYDTEEKNRAGARNPIQDNRRDRDWIFENKKQKQKSAKDWKSNLGVW